MALDHILMRPQALTRRIGPAEDRIAEEIMDLTSRLIADVAKGGRAKDKLFEGVTEAMQAILADFKSRIDSASASLKAWLEPIISAFDELGNVFAGVNTPGQAMHALARLLLLLADTLGTLSTAQIELRLNALLAIFTDDLGITRPRMEAFFSNAVDIVAQKMKEDFIGGDHSEQSHNEYLIGCYLEKLKRHVRLVFDELELEIDLPKMVAQIAGYIQSIKWDEVRLVAQRILADVGNTMESLAILIDIFSGKFNVTVEVEVEGNFSSGSNSVSGNVSGSVGTGDLDPVSWYATYFERKFIHNIPVGVADRNRLQDEPFFDRMSFKRTSLTPKTMEEVAHGTEVFASFMQMILHLVSTEDKDVSSNLLHAGLQLLDGIMTLLLASNNDPEWVTAYQVLHNNYTDILTTIGFGLLTGLESAHPFRGEEQGIFWLTLVGKDVTEALLYKNWMARLRQGLLSILTLLNADLTAKPNSENHKHVEGLAMVCSEIFLWIGSTFSGRKNFGFPAHGGAGKFVGLWIGGALMAWAGGITGWLAGWGVAVIDKPAGKTNDDYFPGGDAFLWVMLESLLTGAFKYPIYNYFVWNGKTDGGKFGQDNAFPPNLKVFEKGYPSDKTKSPYKQPYAKGMVRQCAQNNLGPWSHNANTQQIYAYDWDHDHGTEVLAMRGGYVDGFSDVMPDHTTLQDNNLQVKHTDLSEGTIPNPDVDWDWTAAPVITTGQYIHAKHYGIRHVFAAMGIPLQRIKGAHVSQGRFIMFSGDTGMSFYNHLHAHVSSPNSMSIPFIFRDSPEDDGRLRDLTWYGSDNERLPNPIDLSPICPPEQASQMLRTNPEIDNINNDRLELIIYSNNDSVGADVGYWIDNIYKGCVVVFRRGNNTDICREIETSKWEEVAPDRYRLKVKLTANWPSADAPAGSTVTIDTRARATTSDSIILDAYADYTRDDYSGAMIYVWWTNERGNTVTQAKRIASYDKATRKVTIDGTWDITPPSFVDFEIGQRPYSAANDFKKRFAYIAPDNPAVGSNPRYVIGPYVSFPPVVNQGIPGGVGAVGAFTLQLAGSAPSDPLKIQGQCMCIANGPLDQPNTRILAMRRIVSYNAGTKTVTVTPAWDFEVNGTHHYAVGQNIYANATADDKKDGAFMCPDTNANQYTPTDFTDGRKPYLMKTY